MSIGVFFQDFLMSVIIPITQINRNVWYLGELSLVELPSLEAIDREKFWPTYPLVNSLPWRIYYERNVSSYINF